jgi:hypothetical protein
MSTLALPSGLRELGALIGHETALDQYHGVLRRAALGIQPVHGYGTVQVTCSDEFQGEIRASFDREVARALTAGSITGNRRTFLAANMGGRLEPGALVLADQHFATNANQYGSKLMLVEISSHVGVRAAGGARTWGQLERFGNLSDCCGALALLLAGPKATAAVRHPWFDQLSAFFGAERLAALRADTSPTRMLSAAIIHAVLQAESALADVLREPPAAPTHVLIASLVVVNQPGSDDVIPVGFHHISCANGAAHVEHGDSLRSTPGALSFSMSGGSMRVTSNEEAAPASERRVEGSSSLEFRERVHALHSASDEFARARAELVKQQLAQLAKQIARFEKDPHLKRVYARPVLRGLMQSLSVSAPDVALAAMLVQTGHKPERAEMLRKLLREGASRETAQRVLHDIEAEIQQLGHGEAHKVIDILLEEAGKLWKSDLAT